MLAHCLVKLSKAALSRALLESLFQRVKEYPADLPGVLSWAEFICQHLAYSLNPDVTNSHIDTF